MHLRSSNDLWRANSDRDTYFAIDSIQKVKWLQSKTQMPWNNEIKLIHRERFDYQTCSNF